LRDHVRGKWMGAALDDRSLQRAAALHRSGASTRLWLREQVGITRLRPLGSATR
jgi:hypothetical protein